MKVTLGKALSIWPRCALFDLRWKFDIFHLLISFSDFSLCKYSNFHLSCHPWNGVNKIYYQYNDRQDLLVRNQPLHCTLQCPPKCHLCEQAPSSPCSGCCPCTPSWSSLSRSAHSSGDQGIQGVSSTRIVLQVTAFAQQFSVFSEPSMHSISFELPNNLSLVRQVTNSIFPFYR